VPQGAGRRAGRMWPRPGPRPRPPPTRLAGWTTPTPGTPWPPTTEASPLTRRTGRGLIPEASAGCFYEPPPHHKGPSTPGPNDRPRPAPHPPQPPAPGESVRFPERGGPLGRPATPGAHLIRGSLTRKCPIGCPVCCDVAVAWGPTLAHICPRLGPMRFPQPLLIPELCDGAPGTAGPSDTWAGRPRS